MVKSRRLEKKLRFKKIILCAAIVISMAAFYVLPFSANEVVYLNKIISSSDFASLVYLNSSSSVRYGYSDLSNSPFLSIYGSSPNGYYRINSDNLPYSASGFISGSSLYWQGVRFTNAGDTKRIVISLSPFLDLYFDDFTFVFYIILPYGSGSSFSIQYLDSDSNFNNVNFTSTLISDGTLGSIYSNYSSIISSDYYNYVLTNHYYTNIYGYNVDSNLTLNNVNFYKVSCSFSNLNKTNIKSIIFNVNFSSDIDYFPYLFPYVYFDSSINAYILSSQDEVYTETLNNQRQIIAQQQQIINQLEEITGPISQEHQQEIDNIEDQLATEFDELQDQLDIIDSVEMPTELPTMDTSEMEEQFTYIGNAFGDLSLLNIFNVIVPAGCAGFLIYTILRRF